MNRSIPSDTVEQWMTHLRLQHTRARDMVWLIERGATLHDGHEGAVMTDANVRPQVAHWAVRQVTGPGDHPVAVAIVLKTQNLTAPGEEDAGGKAATKILYQEALGAPR